MFTQQPSMSIQGIHGQCVLWGSNGSLAESNHTTSRNDFVKVNNFFVDLPYFLYTICLFCFLAHLSTECSVSYCDHSPSVGVRPSVHNLLVNTLASTNINQSSPNLVKMYMTTRARMSFYNGINRTLESELSALELENLPCLTMFIL